MQLSSILVVEGNNATRWQLFICLFRETGTFLFVSINKKMCGKIGHGPCWKQEMSGHTCFLWQFRLLSHCLPGPYQWQTTSFVSARTLSSSPSYLTRSGSSKSMDFASQFTMGVVEEGWYATAFDLNYLIWYSTDRTRVFDGQLVN